MTSNEECEGNRPPRRVYAITPDGEVAFQSILREQLAAYPASEFPGLVSLSFLDALPSDESVPLRQERREKIEAEVHELDTLSEEVRSVHPELDYLYRHYTAEIEWLDKIINRLGSAREST